MALLHGRYQILTEVGRGGFGTIYQARDTQLGNRMIAIKELISLSESQQDQEEAAEAFQREALMLAGLMHPNLPRIYEQFQQNGKSYLVMDFIQGEALESYLQRTHTQNGNRTGLPSQEVFPLALQLCAVLEYLHEHEPPIIFRDLKPSNVMRTPTGHLYLIDFGIARHLKPGQARDTMAFGSPGYAAPEQYGRSQTTPRSDIYSLGALLHTLFSGHDPSGNPFLFPPLSLGNPSLERLISSMLEIDPLKRPENMNLIKYELQRAAPTPAMTPMPQQAITTTTPSSPPTLTNEDDNPPVTAAETLQLVPSSDSTPEQPAKGRTRNVLQPAAYGSIGSTYLIYQGHSLKQTSPVAGVAWSPLDDWIISAGDDGTIHVWHSTNGALRLTNAEQKQENQLVTGVSWSADGRFIATCGYDCVLHIWNAQTGRQAVKFTGHSAPIHDLSWSHTRSGLLATASSDGTVIVWDMGEEKIVFTGTSRRPYWQRDLPDHTFMTAVAWSPDGTRLAFGGSDSVVQVWKMHPRNYLPHFAREVSYRGHEVDSTIQALVWSPDGRFISSASTDGHVYVWRSDDAKTVTSYKGHRGTGKWPRCLTWSPDGQWLASGGGGKDHDIHLWEPLKGKETYIYHGHHAPINSISWSPTGQLIASASNDGTVHIWQGVNP